MHLCDFCSNFHRNLLFSRFCDNKRLSWIVIFQKLPLYQKRVISNCQQFYFSIHILKSYIFRTNQTNIYIDTIQISLEKILQTSCIKSFMVQHTYKDLHSFSKKRWVTNADKIQNNEKWKQEWKVASWTHSPLIWVIIFVPSYKWLLFFRFQYYDTIYWILIF